MKISKVNKIVCGLICSFSLYSNAGLMPNPPFSYQCYVVDENEVKSGELLEITATSKAEESGNAGMTQRYHATLNFSGFPVNKYPTNGILDLSVSKPGYKVSLNTPRVNLKFVQWGPVGGSERGRGTLLIGKRNPTQYLVNCVTN